MDTKLAVVIGAILFLDLGVYFLGWHIGRISERRRNSWIGEGSRPTCVRCGNRLVIRDTCKGPVYDFVPVCTSCGWIEKGC